jgi:hypothetical protein
VTGPTGKFLSLRRELGDTPALFNLRATELSAAMAYVEGLTRRWSSTDVGFLVGSAVSGVEVETRTVRLQISRLGIVRILEAGSKSM